MHAIPQAGELYLQPALTLSGRCDILLWEAVPGGPLDCFADRPGPVEQLARMRGLLRDYLPWEDELWAEAEPTDALGNLYGAVTPIVRYPVARLDGGCHALGIGDTVVINDPITGQGSNNATRAAARYLRAIIEHGDAAFTADWMRQTFDRHWYEEARHSVDFTTTMLAMPEHLQRVFGAAAEQPQVARRLANTYAEPSDYAAWLATPELVDAYLASL